MTTLCARLLCCKYFGSQIRYDSERKRPPYVKVSFLYEPLDSTGGASICAGTKIIRVTSTSNLFPATISGATGCFSPERGTKCDAAHDTSGPCFCQSCLHHQGSQVKLTPPTDGQIQQQLSSRLTHARTHRDCCSVTSPPAGCPGRSTPWPGSGSLGRTP